MIKLSTYQFQWQLFEQIWPFERFYDGSILYAKEFDVGALSNGGTVSVAHGISPAPTPYLLNGVAIHSTIIRPITAVTSSLDVLSVAVVPTDSTIKVYCTGNWSVYTGRIRMVYKKG